MTDEQWRAMDDYITDCLFPADPELDAALEASAAAGLPSIQVSASQGQLLQLLARGAGARAILEVGTLGGYSTIWLGRALPADGRLVTIEVDPKHAEVAQANIERAGLSEVVAIRVGRALDVLPTVLAEGEGPFDFVFVDADKTSNADYFAWARRLARPGTLIVVDNVVRGGAVADARSDDPDIVGTRRLFDEMAAARAEGVAVTAIQTVGAKGHDGFAIALVT
jgi:predicted O-methyltransferase YrrM